MKSIAGLNIGQCLIASLGFDSPLAVSERELFISHAAVRIRIVHVSLFAYCGVGTLCMSSKQVGAVGRRDTLKITWNCSP